MRVIIVGAGGHAHVVADIFREAERVGGAARVVGYLDDAILPGGELDVGPRVLGPVRTLWSIPHDGIIIAVGDNRTRARLWQDLAAGERLIVARHPSAVISQNVQFGEGVMICAGALVNTGTVVGRGTILNTGCSVDHHSKVGAFVHIAPGVHMGGEVTVGDAAFVGIGATVLPRIALGEGCTVGAGAVVTRDVPAGVTVVGCPARPVGSRS